MPTTTLARHTDPSTSHEAAESVPVTALEAVCLTALRNAPMGLTSEELAHVTRHSLVAISPRLRPLAKDKRLIYAGSKRKNLSGRLAIVWFAAQTQPTLF